MSGLKQRICSVTVFSIFSIYSGALAYPAESVEVVQSVPIETTLAAPGIQQTQQVWLDMIASAKKTIDFEQFYINNQVGESLDPVLAAIRSAASKGVQIRFLVDSQFYKNYPQAPNDLSQVANIQVKMIDYSPLGGIQHSKYFVVDQSEVFVGSANFDWLALSHIHEVGLHIRDTQIGNNLETVFAKDWEAGTTLPGAARFLESSLPNLTTLDSIFAGLVGFQLVASPAAKNPAEIPDSLTAITQLLDSAQTSISIQMYEYTTKVYKSSNHWKTLDTAIRSAAARGVHVQLLVDATALKTGRADLQALARVKNIVVKVVTIPQWSGGPIPYARLAHSKYFVVDSSSAWVGTENWSEEYFTSSRNVGITLHSADIAAKLGQVFAQVWNSSYITSP